jgi:hypothetical protein
MSQLSKQYEAETNQVALYRMMNGSDYHTLRYVNWLEAKVERLQQKATQTSIPCSIKGCHHPAVVSVCIHHAVPDQIFE